jgi:hypothetical protein
MAGCVSTSEMEVRGYTCFAFSGAQMQTGSQYAGSIENSSATFTGYGYGNSFSATGFGSGFSARM